MLGLISHGHGAGTLMVCERMVNCGPKEAASILGAIAALRTGCPSVGFLLDDVGVTFDLSKVRLHGRRSWPWIAGSPVMTSAVLSTVGRVAQHILGAPGGLVRACCLGGDPSGRYGVAWNFSRLAGVVDGEMPTGAAFPLKRAWSDAREADMAPLLGVAP